MGAEDNRPRCFLRQLEWSRVGGGLNGYLDSATAAVYDKYEAISPDSGNDALKIINHAAARDDLGLTSSLVMADTQQYKSLDSSD